MAVDSRVFQSSDSSELYITGEPECGCDVQKQAAEIFKASADVLRSENARPLQERIFATSAVMDAIVQTRKDIYGDLDDGVAPTQLIVPKGVFGPFAGIQIHAATGSSAPEIVEVDGVKIGRLFQRNGSTLAALSGITCHDAGDAESQAKAMFETAELALKKVGTDMFSVARTWMWLGDVLSWYGEFNEVRNRFFAERGLLNGHPQHCLPASTGIGLGPSNGASCAMDLVAIVQPSDGVRYFLQGGDQNSAYDYGSAFSRAATATTPAGETLYVSGTAAIDEHGVTEHLDDSMAQIRDTIAHVRAILTAGGCSDDDVVHAMAYSKTPEIEREFAAIRDELSWPLILAVGDVCRDDLLFEIEATACPGAKKV